MKKNIGVFDRAIRLAIAILLFILAYVYQSWILLAAALFTLFEALASWCVLYQLLGKNSCPISQDKNLKK
jgi:divalent metal cation (Fe/Co/Zn/Cd) transporter